MEDFMKREHNFFKNKDNNLEDFKAKHNYQIVEEYWGKEEKNVKRISLNFANQKL